MRGLSDSLYLQIIQENHENQGYKPLSGEIHEKNMAQGPVYRAGFILYIRSPALGAAVTTPYELFLERALRLEGSRFWTWLNTPKGEIDLQRFGEGDWLAHPNLNQDELEAFCLNLRLLIQKRDGFSIDQIRGLAQEWPPQYEKQREGIEHAAVELERRLDEPSFVSLPNREKTTNRDLFDVVFYGGLVHANLNKRDEFRRLSSAGVFSFFAFRTFCGVLFHYRNCVVQIAYHLSHYYLSERERGHAG